MAFVLWGLGITDFRPLLKAVRESKDPIYDRRRLKKPLEFAYERGNVLLNALAFGQMVQKAMNGAASINMEATFGPVLGKAIDTTTAALGTVFHAEVLDHTRFAQFLAECITNIHNIIALVCCILFLGSGFRITRDLSTVAFLFLLAFSLFNIFPQMEIYLSERGLHLTFLQTLATGTRFLLGPDQSCNNIPSIFFLFAESLVYIFMYLNVTGSNYFCALVNVLYFVAIWNYVTE